MQEVYSTQDIEEALRILNSFNVEYIIIGDLEKAYYPSTGITKFTEMVTLGYLAISYENPGTIIYEVIPHIGADKSAKGPPALTSVPMAIRLLLPVSRI